MKFIFSANLQAKPRYPDGVLVALIRSLMTSGFFTDSHIWIQHDVIEAFKDSYAILGMPRPILSSMLSSM